MLAAVAFLILSPQDNAQAIELTELWSNHLYGAFAPKRTTDQKQVMVAFEDCLRIIDPRTGAITATIPIDPDSGRGEFGY